MNGPLDMEGRPLREFFEEGHDRVFDRIRIEGLGHLEDPRTSDTKIKTFMATMMEDGTLHAGIILAVPNPEHSTHWVMHERERSQTTFDKQIVRHGNSLVVRITEEAHLMGLDVGDTATITLRRRS